MSANSQRGRKRSPLLRVVKSPDEDPNYQARLDELERHKRAAYAEFREAAAPLLADLVSAGYISDSGDWATQAIACKGAVPIMAKWLPKLEHRRVKAAIVQALSVPWASGIAEGVLLSEFRAAPETENLGLKWTIANALEVLASDKIFDDLVELSQDKRHGRAREMLTLALGKMKNPRAVEVLIGLLDDEDVVGNAVMALGKLRNGMARPHLQRLTSHPKRWVRKEAIKALAKTDA